MVPLPCDTATRDRDCNARKKCKLDRVVNRVKPWFMVNGLSYGSVHGFVYGTRFIVHGVFHNVLLEHGGLPCIFPFNVHFDFGHHCDTQ